MDRFLVATEHWRDTRAVLSSEESHHCLRVMRKKPGDRIEIFDGIGRWGRGVISGNGDKEVDVAVDEQEHVQRKAPSLFLSIAVTKGKVMELIIQKAVELGIDRIQPLLTDNVSVRVSEKILFSKVEKWRRVAVAACKQSGQNFVPEVCPAVNLGHYLSSEGRGIRLLASLDESARPLRCEIGKLSLDDEAVELFIGPEGDFSLRETRLAINAGLHPVSFGSLVLRVETAVIYGLSVLAYELR